MEDFREREHAWVEDWREWKSFSEKQWADFSYKTTGGESLAEVQERNIAALEDILNRHNNKSIVIGTHGTALSTIINYYDNSYGYSNFMEMVSIMPWVVKMDFDDNGFVGMSMINLLNKLV